MEVSGSGYRTVKITAKAPGKTESDPVSYNVTFGGADKSAWGGRNSRLFYSPTLSFLLSNIVASEEMKQNTKNYLVNAVLPNVQNATGKKTKLIYAIIPDPATCYYDEQRDYIAGSINGVPNSPMRQFVEVMNGASEDIYALDLLTALRKHKDDRIYFTTDTHYTEYGAYYVYREIMNVVKKYHPDSRVRTVEGGDYRIDFIDVSGGDLCGMVGIGMREVVPFFIANFSDTGSYYVSKRNDGIKSAGFGPSGWERFSTLNDSNNPTAYLIGDSYGCYILPFIGANFSKVWTNEGVLWNYPIDYNLLAEQKPDYIIFVVCERNVGGDFGMILSMT